MKRAVLWLWAVGATLAAAYQYLYPPVAMPDLVHIRNSEKYGRKIVELEDEAAARESYLKQLRSFIERRCPVRIQSARNPGYIQVDSIVFECRPGSYYIFYPDGKATGGFFVNRVSN